VPAQPPYVGVVGASQASAADRDAAETVGRALAGAGAILVCGGRGGVMEAACHGAVLAGGMTVGLLPGVERDEANEWVKVALPTGVGELRNGLIVRAVDAVIAVGGAYGTLSEIALALASDVPVVGVGTWSIEGIQHAATPEEAVERALTLARWPASSPPT
jgi:uncharacterized protein (TIGR00725 family)